jgi:hypothetical protein
VTSKHFDVVVVGRSIGALSAAALLARRDFTVLLVGQNERPPTYRIGERVLHRRAFTMLAATSPTWRKIVVELAQSQTWKRRMVPASPMLQVLAPGRRLDVPPDMARFGREIDREYPELRRLVDELYDELARVNGAADEAFEQEAIWPPGTFWERRETARIAAMLPYVRADPDADLLADFPRGHAFRQLVATTALFGTDLSSLPPPFAVARLHGGWTRGLLTLPRGEEELEEFLLDRITAHGGVVDLGDRVAKILTRRSAVTGVQIDGDPSPISATFVITDLDGEGVAALSAGEGLHKRALREWPRITSTVGRFVTSIVLATEALPKPLGPEAFLLPAAAARPNRDPRASIGPVHLQRHDRGDGETLLVAEALLPDRGPVPRELARKAVLDLVLSELPFADKHVRFVDSPHDGKPLWAYDRGKSTAIDRVELKGASRSEEPMVRQLEVDPPGYLALGGEPLRGPIERTLLVGRSVLPGLGQEGQLLAAWGAARLVTKSDRQKERMRRDLWSKVEIG